MNVTKVQIRPDILLGFGKADKFVYSAPLVGDFARQTYHAAVELMNREYAGVSAFDVSRGDRTFIFDENSGEIIGSSTFFNILVDKVLRKQGMWIPTFAQSKILDAHGKLSNGVYRENGIVLYSNQNPNKKIALLLSKNFASRKLEAPFVIPFKTLDLEKADNEHGINIVLNDDLLDVLSGTDARRAINGWVHSENSGLLRSGRGSNGEWCSYYWSGRLANSSPYGSIDRICGEASMRNIKSLMSEGYNTKILELRQQMTAVKAQREKDFMAIDNFFIRT